jgi:hypothetical protein
MYYPIYKQKGNIYYGNNNTKISRPEFKVIEDVKDEPT